jgi:acyl carrier protein
MTGPSAEPAAGIRDDDRHGRAALAVRGVLIDVLALDPDRVAAFDADTPLFGALPELDSLAVAGLLTELEDRLDIVVDDDEVDGELFETFGSLVAFAAAKLD